MIPREQLEDRGIRDEAVLRAIRSVPRHEFVAPELRPFAYEDRPLSIGYDVTISQPFMVASMTELLTVEDNSRVLEIGTGSGYQAAVLSLLARSVYSIERIPELVRQSEARLMRLGFRNVCVRSGDGFLGWPEEAPFDRILLTAAPPGLPEALISQLAAGGRLVAPVGTSSRQNLVVLDKGLQGQVREETVYPVSFVPMLPGRK